LETQLKALITIALATVLSACVVAPPRRTVFVPAPQVPRIFAYPAKGQSSEQADRDRYECHSWAVQQTGFDPTLTGSGGYERVVVRPPAPTGTIAGAIGGAVVGSILSGGHDGGGGVVFGALAGAMIGSASDANAQSQVHAQINESVAVSQSRAGSYRRAMGACLEGRGYTVS